MQQLQEWERNIRLWGRLRVFGWTVFFLPIAWDTLVYALNHNWREFFFRFILLYCIGWRLYLIITGRIIRVPKGMREPDPPVTASQIYGGLTALFLLIAFALNNGDEELSFPSHINSLNRSWVFAFLGIAGFFATALVFSILLEKFFKHRLKVQKTASEIHLLDDF